MPKVTITLEDEDDGNVNIGADFGDFVEQTSQAHQMGIVLLESVLRSSKSYTKIEDSAPDINVEPSKIIVPE